MRSDSQLSTAVGWWVAYFRGSARRPQEHRELPDLGRLGAPYLRSNSKANHWIDCSDWILAIWCATCQLECSTGHIRFGHYHCDHSGGVRTLGLPKIDH